MPERKDDVEQTKVWKVLFCSFEELENACNYLASDGYMIIKIIEVLMQDDPPKEVAVVAFSQEQLAKVLQARNAGTVAAQLADLAKQVGVTGQPP